MAQAQPETAAGPTGVAAGCGECPPPSLENDSFVDKAIATVGICLWERHDGGVTSAVQLLIRPTDVRGDESGAHPGEQFVMVTITREEMRGLLAELDADWADIVKYTGDPNVPGSRP